MAPPFCGTVVMEAHALHSSGDAIKARLSNSPAAISHSLHSFLFFSVQKVFLALKLALDFRFGWWSVFLWYWAIVTVTRDTDRPEVSKQVY